jgi:hypothetical protein
VITMLPLLAGLEVPRDRSQVGGQKKRSDRRGFD